MEFATQAKFFLKNAHFLEIFNKILPIYHLYHFLFQKLIFACRQKKFEVLGHFLCILSQFFCYLLLQVNKEIINPRARHLVFLNKQINILVDFLSPAVVIGATGAKNWEFWLFDHLDRKIQPYKAEKNLFWSGRRGYPLYPPYVVAGLR